MAQRDRRGGMTEAELIAGGIEQTAWLDENGLRRLVELYPGSGDLRWRVSYSRQTVSGDDWRDVTEHRTLREARREFRRIIRNHR